MKHLRKLSTLLLALAMVFTMGMSVFAANTPTSGGPNDHDPAKHISENSFTIKKDIVLFNVDTSQIYEPNITYSYEVAPATVANGTTIEGLLDNSDNNSGADAEETVTVAVRSGITGGVTIKGNQSGATAGTTADVVFGTSTSKVDSNKENAPVNANSKHVDKDLTVIVNPDTIYASGANKAGVYRYSITDKTTDATLEASGVDRDTNYRKVIFLDVYLKYNATNDGLVPYGYVLHKGDKDLSLKYVEGSTENTKLSGYDMGSEKDDQGNIISDQYHTFNVEVSKAITGGMADKNNRFPFKVDLSNAKVTSLADFYYVVKQNGATGDATDGVLNTEGVTSGSKWELGTLGTTSAIMFKNDDNILITGLPKGTKINVAEYNNTPDKYTLTAKTNNSDATLDNNATSKVLDANNGTGELKDAFAVAQTSGKDTVAFTNTLKEISPTNVVMRYAPYLFILGGAALLLVVSRRRKAEQE